MYFADNKKRVFAVTARSRGTTKPVENMCKMSDSFSGNEKRGSKYNFYRVGMYVSDIPLSARGSVPCDVVSTVALLATLECGHMIRIMSRTMRPALAISDS